MVFSSRFSNLPKWPEFNWGAPGSSLVYCCSLVKYCKNSSTLIPVIVTYCNPLLKHVMTFLRSKDTTAQTYCRIFLVQYLSIQPSIHPDFLKLNGAFTCLQAHFWLTSALTTSKMTGLKYHAITLWNLSKMWLQEIASGIEFQQF